MPGIARPLVQLLDRDQLDHHTDSTTFARGNSYFRNGAVERIEIGNDEIRAKVRGSCVYDVRLLRHAKKVFSFGCDCPVGRDGVLCKHVVATVLAAIERARETPAATAVAPDAAAKPEAVQAVTAALALLWTHRSRTVVYKLLSDLRWHGPNGRPFTQEEVRHAIRKLKTDGGIVELPGRDGFYRLSDEIRRSAYRELLEKHRVAVLREALRSLEYPGGTYPGYRLPMSNETVIALVRLELVGGTAAPALAKLRDALPRSIDWGHAVREAILAGFDPETFGRITEEWRWLIAYEALWGANAGWSTEGIELCHWLASQPAVAVMKMPSQLRLALAEHLLHRGDRERMREILAGITESAADALRAGALVHEGRWAEAQSGFESALERRKQEVKARKRLLPVSLAWLYPIALLAQGTPRHLEAARKFCVGESGQRNPSAYEGWGLFVNAAGSRLGECKLEPAAFVPVPHIPGLEALWRLLLAAWLRSGAREQQRPAEAVALKAAAAAIRTQCARCGFTALVAQVDAAEAVLRGSDAAPWFFAAVSVESWRSALVALQSLAAVDAATGGDERTTRLVWALHIGSDGSPAAIEPFEQRRGARGWGTPKPVPLSRIAKDQRLSPDDARVARAIRQDGRSSRDLRIDTATAIVALIGHPGVVLADNPEQRVDMVEGTPEVEVVRQGDQYVVRMTPQPPASALDDDDDEHFGRSYPKRRDAPDAAPIALVRDSATRVRVIRFSAAQQRASQLIGSRLSVPAEGAADLTQALRALAGHFEVHADDARAGREVDADSRLRAELRPVGSNLSLRLVVAPLGDGGPRVAPGRGRARLMASIDGETVGAERDLDAERANLRAVLDALPDLDERGATEAGCEWSLDDPEIALAVVESLPRIDAVGAVEWPSGKAVRVHTVDVRQLSVSVRAERDWFRVEGGVAIDGTLSLDIARLIEASRTRSRFVPIGDGVYAALTQSLRDRLADIAAVAEIDKRAAQVPKVAAAWLTNALEGAASSNDRSFGDALGRLRTAQDEAIAVPATLQAELRSYQVDGYVWAMRLAAAGLGGCLADDMGLGKTLQGLAVLLARAAGGAAVIVAPTSVCGNWQREAARFAPTLNVSIYGEAERDATVMNAGAHDVVLVSYTLLQQSRERFASRAWHTVIADEAQAVKNAVAKRAQALFDLDADFRLAMTGTPVENRLSELWSIMRFANPGLLGTITRFNERFAAPIERDRDRGAQQTLRRLIAPFMLRRTKAQVLDDLPPRTELLIALTPDAPQAAHYEALRQQAVANATEALASQSGQARFNVLAQLTRLRRAACDPRLVTPNLPFEGAKVRALADLAAELKANGHKALVFSQFVDFLSLLRPALEAGGIVYQYLDGSTPAAERTKRVEAFQSGAGDLFLISLKAGGFGLNLTAADYVVITDPWWNPAAEDQAMGRAHRIGQQRPVTVYRLVMKNTVEERIVSLHHEKRALADSILAGADVAQLPSAEELIELMRG